MERRPQPSTKTLPSVMTRIGSVFDFLTGAGSILGGVAAAFGFAAASGVIATVGAIAAPILFGVCGAFFIASGAAKNRTAKDAETAKLIEKGQLDPEQAQWKSGKISRALVRVNAVLTGLTGVLLPFSISDFICARQAFKGQSGMIQPPQPQYERNGPPRRDQEMGREPQQGMGMEPVTQQDMHHDPQNPVPGGHVQQHRPQGPRAQQQPAPRGPADTRPERFARQPQDPALAGAGGRGGR